MAILKAQPATAARTGYNSEHAGDLVVAVAEFDIEVDNAGTAIASADVVEMLRLPHNHAIVDVILDTDAIAAGVVDVGLDGGAELMTGVDVGTAAASRADVAGFSRIPLRTDQEKIDAGNTDQFITVTFTTGSAAVAGKFRLTAMYRASDYDL